MASVTLEDLKAKELERPIMVNVWKQSKQSHTILMAIPESYVKRYEIKPHDKLLVTDTPSGILLRQVNLEDLIQ